MIKSINIFGITGGIGYEFFKKIRKADIDICGYYNTQYNLANKIIIENPKVKLKKIDLGKEVNFNKTDLPNYEGLLYVAGTPCFAKSLFEPNSNIFYTHLNLDVSSLFLIIQSLLNKKNVKLKKIIVVTSNLPEKINNIYHASKKLQNELLQILIPVLKKENITISIIKTGWVKTGMYQKYIQIKEEYPKNAVEPKEIADECLKLFS